MKLLEALTSAFINTFGITQPTEAARRRASWFIAGMLALAVLVVICGGLLFYNVLHR